MLNIRPRVNLIILLQLSGNLQVAPRYLQAQTKTSLLKIVTSAGSNCQTCNYRCIATCVKDCKKDRPAAFEKAAKILKFAFVKIPVHSSRFCDCKATNVINTLVSCLWIIM